jgi:hypothetical protein
MINQPTVMAHHFFHSAVAGPPLSHLVLLFKKTTAQGSQCSMLSAQ